MHGVAVVHHQLGGLRADVHHRNTLAAVLRQHGGVTGGERFVDRLLHRKVGGIHRADDGVVFLYGGRNQVDVDFQPRRQHLARIAVPGVVVHHEILREELQDHTVFHQLHPGGPLDHAPHVGLLNLLYVPKLEHTAAIGPA